MVAERFYMKENAMRRLVPLFAAMIMAILVTMMFYVYDHKADRPND